MKSSEYYLAFTAIICLTAATMKTGNVLLIVVPTLLLFIYKAVELYFTYTIAVMVNKPLLKINFESLGNDCLEDNKLYAADNPRERHGLND